MKPFWISCLILGTTIALLLWNVRYLESYITPLQEKLQQAEAFARVNDWDTATQMTQEVHDALEKKKLYLNVTLPHNALDQMYLQIAESLSYLKHEKIGEYQASNQMLIHRMNLLYGAESLNLNNLF